MTNILGIFAKQPQPGAVKTRLASATSAAFAAQVAEACLRDTLTRLATISAERRLVFAPDGDSAWFAAVAQGRYQLAPQGAGDLGERLERFFQACLQTGSERVVVVGADSPTLPLALVDRAFRELHEADVILGPATDGGYYLIGCTGHVPPVFRDIVWSGPTVLHDTVTRLGVGPRLALLPPWYDIDTLEDWFFLQGHVAAVRRSGGEPGIPNTEELFARRVSHVMP